MAAAEPPLLETHALTVRAGPVTACRALDLRLASGTCWGILGRNGAGKSTLLHTLAGLRAPDEGGVHWQGRDLRTLSRRETARDIGLVPQGDDLPFPLTVRDAALAGRHPHLGRWQHETAEDQARVGEALRAVALDGCEDRPLDTLSGGERRRLALATLLVQDPAVALCDEPTNHLDPGQQLAMMTLLYRRFATAGRALVVVLHDAGLALRCCSHLLLVFGDGRTVAGEAAALGDPTLLGELYGHPMALVEGDGLRSFVPR
jgi:iron complex transport system ATP-binding protein